MVNPVFPWNILIGHLVNNRSACRVIFPFGVMTTGSGPCDEYDFDDFLHECKIETYTLASKGCAKLIIGHDGWDEEKLQSLLKSRAGDKLWVYSQEMVIASLAFGKDIFDVCSTEEMVSFGFGHPALEFLMNSLGFDWPTTDIANNLGANSGLEDGNWAERGLLSQLGYHVGRNGKISSERHLLLDRAYGINVTSRLCDNPEEWGEPNSEGRLIKLANTLSSLARNLKRKTLGDYSEAIGDYEIDLDYLKRKYYHGIRGFQWPDPNLDY